MTKRELGENLFKQGYNCAQAVALSFSDVTGIDDVIMAKLASPFGGGIGRMREVCGAVSGMFFVLGYLYGYDTPGDDELKKALYVQVQELAGKFRERCGHIVCREILKNPSTDPTPSPRTAEYYAQRPCARLVLLAASILEEYIQNHPLADNK